MNILIIGLGGIGSQLSERLCQFLHFYKMGLSRDDAFAREMGVEPPQFDEINITLVDGDIYEVRNRARQDFSQIGPKTEIKERDLREKYNALSYLSINEFITPDNIADIIHDGDVVLLCVDNHKTRNLVNEYCQTLNNIYLFSAGNGFHKADTQRYIRKDGVDIRPNITKYHPDIANANDRHPGEMGCQELANVEPQLIIANWGAAFSLMVAFYTEVILEMIDSGISDSFIDILTGQMSSRKYNP